MIAAAAAAERALARRPRARAVLRAACLWVALGGRSLAREATAVAACVEAGDICRRGGSGSARSSAATRARSTAPGLCRAAIESVAENTVDAVVAPLLWTAVAGAPGALGHRAVNTLDAMVGNRSPRHARFGTPAARTDDLVNWPAARLGAGLTVLLAPAVGGDPRAACGPGGTTRRSIRAPTPASRRRPSPARSGSSSAARSPMPGASSTGRCSAAAARPAPADVARAVRLGRLVGAAATLAAAAACGGRR